MGEVVLWQSRYENAKTKLLHDTAICIENRRLFATFFKDHEYRLKRINGLRRLDSATFKTLYAYTLRFRNVNRWFRNVPLTDLTRSDIKRVYDGLEDGVIVNDHGQPFRSRTDYYNKVFKSTLFRLAGKDALAQEVIEFARPNPKEVRFILEGDFRRLVQGATKPAHRLLLWLAFDIGENINALLQLRTRDFSRELNPETREPEYRVNLRQEILKRSRKPRAELTNFPETVELLDHFLKERDPDAFLFSFDYRNAKKIIDRAATRSGVTCKPKGERVNWKDLRSGMACDLLKKGWTTDEVNARLGHKPSSDEIDRYVNFLAIDRHHTKRKVEQFKLKELQSELEAIKTREKLQAQRSERLQTELEDLQAESKALLEQLVAAKVSELFHKHLTLSRSARPRDRPTRLSEQPDGA